MPQTSLPPSHEGVTKQVKLWLKTIVVGLNLCPFAKRELVKDRIRFFVSAATNEEMLLSDLEAELERLDRDTSIETTLIIHPQVLADFFEYQQFLIWADQVLKPSPITPTRTKSPNAISLSLKAWSQKSCARFFSLRASIAKPLPTTNLYIGLFDHSRPSQSSAVSATFAHISFIFINIKIT